MPTTANTPAPRELSPLFDEALAVTHEFHRSQFRKETAIPYMAHLLQVAGLVLEAGGDEEHAIAALLHDAVEDAGDAEEAVARRDRIRACFGDRVLRLVDACTDGDPAEKEGMSWRARKERYLKHLENADRDVLLISVADKLHNARAILRDYRRLGEPLWSRFRGRKSGTLWYYSALAATYRRAGDVPYSEELMEVVETLQRLATRGSRRHVLNWVATPDFLASLNALVEGTGASVRARDTWMPTGWGAPAEARLDGRGPESSLDIDWDDLRSWWLAEPGRGNVPNWDLLTTCSIDGREGLVLVEAKANAAELSAAGKRPPGTSPDSRANHERIGGAIGDAQTALAAQLPGIDISRDRAYQFSNRIAFAWWLAKHGVPVVLLYLGFTGDERISDVGEPFADAEAWQRHFEARVQRLFPLGALGESIDCGAAAFRLIVRALPVPQDHS